MTEKRGEKNDSNAYWRKIDADLAKRAVALAQDLVHEIIYLSNNKTAATVRSKIARTLTLFALNERGDYRPGRGKRSVK